ncbi:MAG TPA: hypothetical protein VGF06_18005, partial [Terriglobales bacterium]
MRRFRRICLFLFCGYLAFCAAAAVLMVEANLHPRRRSLPSNVDDIANQIAIEYKARVESVSVTAADGVVLRAWFIRPKASAGNSVILLHGQGDNRLGMLGYAELLLRHGFDVLMPDARA